MMRLNFQSYGTGFPVVILHGLFGSLDNWQPIARKLSESFRVFTLDLRNHGRSPHSDVFNYEAMAEDLREFMEQHGLPRIHLLGHSLGGKTAMHFALLHPQLVEKLVVIDIAPKAYPPWHLPIFKALLALDLNSFRDRREIETALAPGIPEVAVRQFLLKNVARDEAGVFRWKMNLPIIYRNYDRLNEKIDTEKSFTGPTLFIRGGQSEYVRDEDRAGIRRLFPNARIDTITDAGHWIHADRPEEFVDLTMKFLR